MILGNGELREEVRACLEDLYTEDTSWRPGLDNLSFNNLGEQEKMILEQERTEEEIHEGL